MNKSQLFLLAGTLLSCTDQPTPQKERPVLQPTPVVITQQDVAKELTVVINGGQPLNEEKPVIDANIGTDIQLQSFLHESRQTIRDATPSEEMMQANAFEKKFNELLKLQKLIDLNSFGGDSYFTSFYSGKVFSLSLSYGEGSYLSLSVGDESEQFAIDDISEILISYGNEYIPVTDKTVDKKANKLIDFVIEGLKETIAAKPIYRSIRATDEDVMKNFGLNLRDDDNSIITLVPPETIVQTLGITDSKGSIFIYCIIDGQLNAGWVKESYLDTKY